MIRDRNIPNTAAAAEAVATSATSAAVLTLLPNPGEFVYLHAVDIYNGAGASAVTAAAPTTITTTNIAGGLAFTVASGVTAGLSTNQAVAYHGGLKAQTAGLPVTVTLPAFATNQTIRVNVAWRSAP